MFLNLVQVLERPISVRTQIARYPPAAVPPSNFCSAGRPCNLPAVPPWARSPPRLSIRYRSSTRTFGAAAFPW
jgi:hypothetical protein